MVGWSGDGRSWAGGRPHRRTRREEGRPARPVAASTDANAAYAAGVPAIAIGVTTDAAEHTEQEWIELAHLPTGLTVLANTVSNLDDAQW
ncbi:hypothetical protein [Dactylosporangium sp. CA-092794]|uniref:hypothetical protein n=1 Tax=Dactylosporangium sp. CA-092794 TaxID=3239929 RepID=UPI003D93BF8D